MDQPADNIADRYRLQLGESWKDWFNGAAFTLQFPGAFQSPVAVSQLLEDTPAAIWPGFMLPDTLPIIGNQYGDWICARVRVDGTLGELIHWYHGGGDWIPVGGRIEEALLHDAVDQYRPIRQQMLRGAFETLTPDHLHQVSAKIEHRSFQQWLAAGLSLGECSAEAPPHNIFAALHDIFAALHDGRYSHALHAMLDNHWAFEATACDLIEEALQLPLAQLMHSHPSRTAAANVDSKTLARWVFDSGSFPPPSGISLPAEELPDQGWGFAEATCHRVLNHRPDLGWASDIYGWCMHRSGRIDQALQVYYDGRLASSFSNQAVRLRTHWFDQRYGKFSIAQLANLQGKGLGRLSDDPYLSVVREAPPGQLLNRVQAYWQQRGSKQLAEGQGADAYASFYRAGWDLGAAHWHDYREILSSLAAAAAAAHWPARERVARTHLSCLEARMK